MCKTHNEQMFAAAAADAIEARAFLFEIFHGRELCIVSRFVSRRHCAAFHEQKIEKKKKEWKLIRSNSSASQLFNSMAQCIHGVRGAFMHNQ